ncbi:MAG: PilW family protein [Bacilli bacterium]
MRLILRISETLRKPPYPFVRTDSESGLTLIELMAAVLIGGMVSFAVVYLWNAVDQLYQSASVHASATTDTSFVYWELEKLAQNTLQVAGTVSGGNPNKVVPVAPGTKVTTLVLQVSTNLAGIAPQNSAVYKAAKANGYICATFAQYNSGMTVLELYPLSDPSAFTPLFSGVTSFSGSTFTVLGATTFSVTLQPSVLSGDHTVAQLAPSTYQYGLGMSGY